MNFPFTLMSGGGMGSDSCDSFQVLHTNSLTVSTAFFVVPVVVLYTTYCLPFLNFAYMYVPSYQVT